MKRLIVLVALLSFVQGVVFAGCVSPLGSEGQNRYASNYKMMVYCNGTNWVSMAGGVSVTIGGASPGGSANSVQTNNGSGGFTGDSGFTYTGGLATVTNISTTALTASGNITAAAFYGDGSHLTGISTQDDRIVSGSLLALANSATGYISLTTGGTTWGYLSNATSYLPSLWAGSVSATGSAGTVSATYGYFKYISATNGLGGAGVSAMASLTDVSETGVLSGMLLRYNGSKWESVAPSTALSATTMFPSWPDAIECYNGSTSNYVIPLQKWNSSGATYGFGSLVLSFDATGNYLSQSSMAAFDCVTNTWSISQLYARGQAFNFIGGQYGGSANQIIFHNGAQGLGDNNLQWISNTAVVSVTGTVSATYGYFKYISATSGLGGAGVSAMASLTDVSETGVISGMLLRYNGSKWESVGASTALSTTTILPNFPDAIQCTVFTSTTDWMIFYHYYSSAGLHYYEAPYGADTFRIQFNADGTYNGNNGNLSSSGSLSCTNKSISQLYANNQAFNFIGGQYGGSANQIIFHNGAQGLGDNNLQWISNTAVVSVTGTVSGTYGYFKNISATTLYVGGVAVTGGGAADRIVSASANVVAGNGGTVSISTGGVSGTAYFDTAGRLVAPGVSATLNMTSVTTLYASGKVGINTAAPSTQLEVNGTISATALYINGVAVTAGGGAGLSCVLSPTDVANLVVVPGGSSATFYYVTATLAGTTCASVGQSRSCSSGALSGSSFYSNLACSEGTLVCAHNTWTQRTGPGASYWFGFASSSDGSKLVTGNRSNGYIYTSTDSGATWTQRTGPGTGYWYGFASSADGTKLVTGNGNGGYIYTSADSGATWTARTGPGIGYWDGFASSADGTKLVTGNANSGYIYTSTDSGATWTQHTGPGTGYWYGFASSADGTKLVTGNQASGGYIYTSTDSGATWTAHTVPGAGFWNSFASSADGTKLVTGNFNGGYIYTSTDSGATWTQRTGPGAGNWYGFASSADGNSLVTGNVGGYIYTSTNSGVTWTAQTSNGSGSWYGFASSADGTKLATGNFGGYIYTNNCN